MKISYDSQADAVYIALVDIADGSVARTLWDVAQELSVGEISLDFTADSKLVGLEILNASQTLPADVLNLAESLELEH